MKQNKFIVTILLLLVFSSGFSETSINSPTSNIDTVKQTLSREMIKNSIHNYSGPCPCPYSRDSRGYRCGKRSAYSRAGGYEILCYPSDINQTIIKEHNHVIQSPPSLKK